MTSPRVTELQVTADELPQVTATYGRRFEIRIATGERVPARIKGRSLKPVCGDRVDATGLHGEAEWLITALRPRRNALIRPDSRGRPEELAANLDLIMIVSAKRPGPDWFLVDRYLCAAELMGVDAAILLNKSDLVTAEDGSDPGDVYDRLDYPVLRTSAETGEGVRQTAGLLRGRLAILVGQSGVGKSSLVNRLIAGAGRETASLSSKSGSGRHTTVNSVLVDLPGGGSIIDSPGVRNYSPVIESAAGVAAGYREILALAGDCRYANCRHLQEPGCAVRSAVQSGSIAGRRYDSYLRLLALTERFAARH